jgi:hypothetical protein
LGNLYLIVHLLLGDLAEGEPLDLQHQDLGHAVEKDLACAFTEVYFNRGLLLHLLQ